ncbi:MAG: DJ-1/PfpI family protein [Desulfotignum sp.]|nr:DJ-1/PfpI family protein [Desulfotignum sp.]
MAKTVLVPVAQGIEEMEAITIIDVLRRAGAQVVVASVDDLTVKAARGMEFKADGLIKDYRDREFDLIVLPGGMPGADNLKKSKDLADLLTAQAAQKKLYGAICASPAVVLHSLGLVTPGAVTCHPGFADLIDGGAVLNQNVVINGHCITSKGAGTALEFALTLVDQLFGDEVLADVKGGLAL